MIWVWPCYWKPHPKEFFFWAKVSCSISWHHHALAILVETYGTLTLFTSGMKISAKFSA